MTESDIHRVVIEFADGAVAIWGIANDDDESIDAVSDAIESVLGPPDTLKA